MAIGGLVAGSIFGAGYATQDVLHGPNLPKLPGTEASGKGLDMETAIKEGKYVKVMIDQDHANISTLAGSVLPKDQDANPLVTSLLQANEGSDLVHVGDEFYVPATDEANKLHQQQFPEENQG